MIRTLCLTFGVVYMKANNSPEAVKVFEKLSKLLPEDSEVCNLMGVALSGAGKRWKLSRVGKNPYPFSLIRRR